jgi:hypothetical protein
VADEMMTCANCGHTQATGEFCEACGTQMPAAAPAAAATVAAAAATPPPEPPAAAPVAPPPAQPAATPPPPLIPPEMTTRGFWRKFFDLSFSEFVTPSVIRVLFIVIMVVIGLSFIGGIAIGFSASAATGVFALIGGIIYGFLSLLFARVLLEVIMVFFHIHDNTREILKKK